MLGDICGAVFIDEAFENVVKCKIGDDYLTKIDATAMDKIVRYFDAKIKPIFEYSPDPRLQERMLKRRLIKLDRVSDNTEEGIADGKLKLE